MNSPAIFIQRCQCCNLQWLWFKAASFVSFCNVRYNLYFRNVWKVEGRVVWLKQNAFWHVRIICNENFSFYWCFNPEWSWWCAKVWLVKTIFHYTGYCCSLCRSATSDMKCKFLTLHFNGKWSCSKRNILIWEVNWEFMLALNKYMSWKLTTTCMPTVATKCISAFLAPSIISYNSCSVHTVYLLLLYLIYDTW